MASYETGSLPEYVDLTQEDIEKYFEVWTIYRALDRKFLPSQIMAEPMKPLSAMLELDSLYAIIEKQFLEEKRKQEKLTEME